MVVEISVARVVFDFIVLALTAIPLLIFQFFVKPYKRGFYCDDESLRYPWQESKVSRGLLTTLGLVIPISVILVTEVFRAYILEKRCSSQFGIYHLGRYNIHRLLVRLYIFVGYFLLGVCFNQLMVDVGKYTIGRLRPHFMEVCQPNPGYESCSNDYKYITDYNCTTKDDYLNHEVHLSFYSGHASFSFYVAWFVSFYLRARIYRPVISHLAVPVMQFWLFAGAAFVSYTRVSDYKHHWSDVLVGMLMGSMIGIINALFIAKVFDKREVPQKFLSRQDVLMSQRISADSI